jgi:hypothetical protein
MAKQHRMAMITIVSVYLAIAPLKWQPSWHGYGLMSAALLLIVIGGLFTAARRLLRIARLLRGKS